MTVEPNTDLYISIFSTYRIISIVQAAKTDGWNFVWQEFNKLYNNDNFANDEEKKVFIDLFFNQCLNSVNPQDDGAVLWEIILKWYHHRKLENRNGSLPANERFALIHICVNIRKKLLTFFTCTEQLKINELVEAYRSLVVSLWRQVFFEPFSPLNLYWNLPQNQDNLPALGTLNIYTELVIRSMYYPFSADEFNIDSEKLLGAPIPFCLKTIIIYWMANTPYFHGEESHRKKLLKYIPQICTALKNHQHYLTPAFTLAFIQEIMTGLWRASYIGGNNIEMLSCFGDFINYAMSRFVIYPKPRIKNKQIAKGDKLRIGYISRNFYKQAVSCYMVNRIIHHNKDKFNISIFALGDHHDEMSELFKKNCDFFQQLPDLTDISGIIHSIIKQDLDILIYADIGMDPLTYALSGLQLAPIQCAMVGHGTSTGMPTIQYYISGDFEASDAHCQYREKLVKLPNLGAAQYMPLTPEIKLSRKDLDIPEDAVIFISCANGIKHGSSRDEVFIQILKNASNAWIVLKPFSSHSSIDYKYTMRLTGKAKKAGVGERLIILPPIAFTKHVLGLLAISDVQLDSYPYGGWTTNMEALYMGLPIVTQEGSLSRSRWGAGMLRALDISEGIAANEQEYVDWAVKFATNKELRQKISTKIKSNAKQVLFNGPAAQPSFEDALLNIYENERNKAFPADIISQSIHPMPLINTNPQQLTIATSLSLIDITNQQAALRSWQEAGFKIFSVNAIDEISLLYSNFKNVEFICAPRDARDKYNKPLIYFDDLLTCLKNYGSKVCGIINPDIHLAKDYQHTIHTFLQNEAINALIYGYRLDVDSLEKTWGQIYTAGFDYIFLDKEILAKYPKQEFCFGLPWWDYWAVLVPLMYKANVKKLTTPIGLHIKHPSNCTFNTWAVLGTRLSMHFHPPFELSAESMPKYAHEVATIINALSQSITLASC